MELTGIQDRGGAGQARRQERKHDQPVQGFHDLLNGMLAFNPPGEIALNKAEGAGQENAALPAMRDNVLQQPSQEAEGATAEPAANLGKEVIKAQIQDGRQAETETRAEAQTQSGMEMASGKYAAVFHAKAVTEDQIPQAEQPAVVQSYKQEGTVPVASPDRPEQPATAVQGNKQEGTVPVASPDKPEQPSQAVQGNKQEGTVQAGQGRKQEGTVPVASPDKPEQPSRASRSGQEAQTQISRRTGSRLPAEDAIRRDAAIGNEGKEFTARISGAAQAKSERFTVFSGAEGSSEATPAWRKADMRLQVMGQTGEPRQRDAREYSGESRQTAYSKGSEVWRVSENVPAQSFQQGSNFERRTTGSRLEGMIARAARELGEAVIPHSENRVDGTKPIRTAQPLEQLEKQPVAGYVNRTESAATAIVEGMNREEALTKENMMPVIAERDIVRTERISQDNEPFKPAERIRTGRPESGQEVSAAASADVREQYDPLELQVRDSIGQKPAGASDQVRQIQTEVLRNLENQKMEFRMQLQPQELGKIDIKLALQDGKLMLEIVASAKATEILSKQLDNLAASIRQYSPDISSVQVVSAVRETPAGQLDNAFSNMNGSGAGQQRQAGHSGTRAGGGQSEGAQMETAASGDIEAEPQRLLNYAV